MVHRRMCIYCVNSYNTFVDYLCTWRKVFFIEDWRHPGWRVVLQKEPRSRRVVDNDDEQTLGISGDLIGLQLPVDMNATHFRPNPVNAGEAVPAAEIARLNALVAGDGHQILQHTGANGQRGRGRGGNRRRLPRRN